MKLFYKFLIGVSLLLGLNISHAYQVLTVNMPCSNTGDVFKTLKKEFGEESVLMANGSEKDVVFSLWVNKKEKTWTMLATKSDLTCIVNTGIGYNISLDFFEKVK